MHWFWRAAIAMAAGTGLGIWVTILLSFGPFNAFITAMYSVCGRHLALSLILFLPILTTAFTVYGLLTLKYGPEANLDSETRCRKCGYILRGIPEPRCSECGERI